MPATELADALEVSVRTIYRDVDALSAAGVSVYAERGSRGGIVLADAYRDALGRFSEGELRALFVSVDDALADIGLSGGRRSALDKLVRAIPAPAREAVRETRARVHVDARRWPAERSSARSPLLDTLREAVWNDRRISVAYTNREGSSTRRTLDPLGLVTKVGVWYLIARDGDTVKTFRVQRIARARVLARTFARPRGFDVGEYWNASRQSGALGNDPGFIATFRMTRRALATASLYAPIRERRRERGSSPPTWIVRVAFHSLGHAMQEALAWGSAEARALGPPELRVTLAERGHDLVRCYS